MPEYKFHIPAFQRIHSSFAEAGLANLPYFTAHNILQFKKTNMIRLKYATLILAISLLTACGSKDENATPDVPASSNTTAPAQSQPMPANGTVNPAPAPASTSTALNPAHGQPGHRCDIAVGAPLNSPAAQPAPTPAITPIQATPAPATPANELLPRKATTNSAAGLNPAHGQPGHRCDIAVGAPLNS
jgi:hypothetical protein